MATLSISSIRTLRQFRGFHSYPRRGQEPDKQFRAASPDLSFGATVVLLTTGSGRFPVRGCAPLLSRIMDDQGERTSERLTTDVQFHWSIRWHRHGSSGPSPDSASRRLQTLRSR